MYFFFIFENISQLFELNKETMNRKGDLENSVYKRTEKTEKKRRDGDERQERQRQETDRQTE